jgi:hypothetical protein
MYGYSTYTVYMANTKYEITKTFTAGLLVGLTITETTTVKFAVGFRCDNPVAGSPYVITAVKEVKEVKRTTDRYAKVSAYGADAAFVANVILTQHSKPATKLRNVLYLLQSGRSVRTAQFSLDVLLVDGQQVSWDALNNLTSVLDVINPKF